MTSKFGEGYFAGKQQSAECLPDTPHSSTEEEEILRKIREVSMNNADFDEMVRQYMGDMDE